MTSFVFFNNKGGVGKTSLVYHLAWIFALKGVSVLAIDLDPQSNLTSAFLSEDDLETLWSEPSKGSKGKTVFDCLVPLIRAKGDILAPVLKEIHPNIRLIPGNLALSTFEDTLSKTWPECLDGDERAFRISSAFYRIGQKALEEYPAQLTLVDVGPNLGAINRAALIACDNVVMPLAPDLFSLQGLRNLGPKLREWRQQWKDRLLKRPPLDEEDPLCLPEGTMQPVGYIVMQHNVLKNRIVKAYKRWVDRIPDVYQTDILNGSPQEGLTSENDPHRLAQIKHYHSLMALAQEARKPMFCLTTADGAIGAHLQAVRDCYTDFENLAKQLCPDLLQTPLQK
jgi:chromosome partitioning protein